jgi:hypothetical protein
MEVASRPRLTAGVALVGAGLVVASTVSPVSELRLPEIHVPTMRTADVNLAAAVNQLAIYEQVFQNALSGATTLVENAKPGAILQQIVKNQLGGLSTLGGDATGIFGEQVPQLLQTVVTDIAAGNVEGATNALLTLPLAVGLPALPTLLINPIQNVVNVINAFTSDSLGTELLLSGLIAPLISTPAAAATALQNVIDAVGSGDPMAVLGAVIDAPATVVDGLLNGGYGPDLGPLTGQQGVIVKAGGLLSPSNVSIGPDGSIVVNTGGPIAALEGIAQKILGAITPPPDSATKAAPAKVVQADATSVPSATAPAVSVTTGSAAAASVPGNTAAGSAAIASGTGTEAAAPAQKPGSTPADGASTTRPSSTASASAPGSATNVAESGSATSDSTTKPGSTSGSNGASSTANGNVTSGNKVKPHNNAGSNGTAGKTGSGAGKAGATEPSAAAGGAKHRHH